MVFGEARPFNVAVITPRGKMDDAQIESAIGEANRHLPDYARVSAWICSADPFSIANGQYTATGCPRREAIRDAYGVYLNTLYEMESTA